MRGVIRSEILRSLSGLSVVAVTLVAVLLPAYVLVSDGSRFDFHGLDSAEATIRLLQPLAWSGVSAAFLGAYAVTREYYYGSIERTLAAVGFRRLFAAKLVAGVVIALGVCVCLFAIWTTGALLLLHQAGMSLALVPDTWRIYAGAAVGAVLGSLIGGAVGWICHNYYLVAAILLVYPLAVESALLRTVPEVARYSPGLVLAAVSVPGYQGRLLELGSALAVALVWTGGLIALAWASRRRVIV